jgi:TolA-binding protein
MRCNHLLKIDEDAIAYATKVLAIENVSTELINEAHYTIAQSYLIQQKYDDAMAEFRVLASSAKSALGAEANYQIANIYYLKNDYKSSEKAVFDFIKGGKGTVYWISKALILQADNYVATANNFQAKATLQGVIEDSEIPELIKVAQEKLDKINADEEAAKKTKAVEEPIKLEFEENTDKQNELFQESTTVPPAEEIKIEQ